jgi:hypothetical protein
MRRIGKAPRWASKTMKKPPARLGGEVRTNALPRAELRERRYARNKADFRAAMAYLARWLAFRSIIGGMFK